MAAMTATGTKRTFYACRRMSVLGGKAAMQRHNRKTDFEPSADFHPRLEIRLATTLRTQPIIISTTASFDSC